MAQICHGPLITAATGNLSGRSVTAYPALEPDMQSAGATFAVTEMQPTPPAALNGRASSSSPQSCTKSLPMPMR